MWELLVDFFVLLNVYGCELEGIVFIFCGNVFDEGSNEFNDSYDCDIVNYDGDLEVDGIDNNF